MVFSMVQKILLTGCTKGLGRAMTCGFIVSGTTVAGLGQDETALAWLNCNTGLKKFWSLRNRLSP